MRAEDDDDIERFYVSPDVGRAECGWFLRIAAQTWFENFLSADPDQFGHHEHG